jgi:hypothetical protein
VFARVCCGALSVDVRVRAQHLESVGGVNADVRCDAAARAYNAWCRREWLSTLTAAGASALSAVGVTGVGAPATTDASALTTSTAARASESASVWPPRLDADALTRIVGAVLSRAHVANDCAE